MHAISRLRGAALALIALPLVVSGCSTGDDEPSEEKMAVPSSEAASSPAPPPSSGPASAASSPSPEAPQSTAVADPLPEMTKPGTRLKMGETAVLDADASLVDDTSRMVAEVTLHSIEEGDQAILDSIQNLEEYKDGTVYYIRGTIKPLAARDEGMKRATWALWGVQEDGVTMASPLFAMEGLAEDCTDTWVVSNPKFGEAHEMCRIAIAMPDKKPAGVAFVRDATAVGEQASDDPYVEDPVLWLLQ